MKTSTVLLVGGAGLLAYMLFIAPNAAQAGQGQQGQGYGPGGGQGQGYGPGGGQGGQQQLPGGGGGMQPTGYSGYGMPGGAYGTQAANYVANYAAGNGGYGGYST